MRNDTMGRASRQGGMIARIGWGLGWGFAMLSLSFLLGAGGHGVFVLLGVFSAPFSLLGTKAAWVGCIPFGGILAAVAHRRELPFVLATHYLAALAVASFAGQADVDRLSMLPANFRIVFSLALAIYIGGHYLLWRTWFRADQQRRRATPQT